MKLAQTNRRQTINLGTMGTVIPGLSRDQTRVARARLAELLLKIHGGRDGRGSDPAAARRPARPAWRLF